LLKRYIMIPIQYRKIDVLACTYTRRCEFYLIRDQKLENYCHGIYTSVGIMFRRLKVMYWIKHHVKRLNFLASPLKYIIYRFKKLIFFSLFVWDVLGDLIVVSGRCYDFGIKESFWDINFLKDYWKNRSSLNDFVA
jgi:hypothetical protein